MNTIWKSGLAILVSLIAIASLGSGGDNAAAGASSLQSGLAVQASATPPTRCNPYDPLSPCALEPIHGYPAGELFIVEHDF